MGASTDGIVWSERFITQPDHGTDEIVADITSSGSIVALTKKADPSVPPTLSLLTSGDNGVTWSGPTVAATVSIEVTNASLTHNGNDWILACSTSIPGFNIFRSTGSLYQFAL